MNRDHRALELDKVLDLLAAQAGLADTAERARALCPETVFSLARRQMDETVAAFDLMARFGAPSFGGAHNINNILRRAQAGACLSMPELLDAAETLRVIRTVREWHGHCEGVETCLDERFALLTANKYMEDRIHACILSPEEMADHASPALADIRRRLRAAAGKIRDKLDSMIHAAAYQKYLQEAIVTIRGGRFVIPVKQEHRSQIPGLVHDTSSTGATVFIEPMAVVEANNECKVLESKEQAEMERILFELSGELGGFADTVVQDYELLVQLDLIFAKARLAYKMKATVPTLTEDGHIVLKRARHPLIDEKAVVPITVELGGDFDTLVITGPNTGGKTVTLKTLGLLSLMAGCGLLPPAGDGTRLSLYGRVLADIGDEQSIEQSLSTFSAHMTNIIRIVREADDRSLVLLDELGAGTDPVEGAALAIAVLERLRAQGARIGATTHYAELKAYAIRTAGVENGSCEFDVATLRPTYRLLVGVPGRSNAFAISERLGMDGALVDRARELVSGEERMLESVVSELDDRRRQLENELEQAREQSARARKTTQDAQAAAEQTERARRQEIEQAKEQARRIVEKARAEADALMRELDEMRRQKTNADTAAAARRKLRSRLNALDDELDPVTATARDAGDYVLPRPLKAGDEVLLVELDKKAVVLTPTDASGQVEVQAGIIRTRVPESGLRLVETAKKEKKRPSARAVGLESRATRVVPTELDLRGQAGDEGVLEVDRFLDSAVLAGLERVTIIHGKGTGALRNAVHAHLRGHRHVKSFRLGAYGEGETGVTVVELK